MSEFKKIVEINGIKMEVDLRHAKTIDTYKIGDRVKVLVKQYSDTYNTYYGVVVDFNEFQSLPTIVVAYIVSSYSEFDVKLVNINSQTKDSAQLSPMVDLEIPISRIDLEEVIARQIATKERELKALNEKQEYVLRVFDKHFVYAGEAQ